MEPNTGFVYKMLANPRSDGPDTRFFLQAYTRTENGTLSPATRSILERRKSAGSCWTA